MVAILVIKSENRFTLQIKNVTFLNWCFRRRSAMTFLQSGKTISVSSLIFLKDLVSKFPISTDLFTFLSIIFLIVLTIFIKFLIFADLLFPVPYLHRPLHLPHCYLHLAVQVKYQTENFTKYFVFSVSWCLSLLSLAGEHSAWATSKSGEGGSSIKKMLSNIRQENLCPLFVFPFAMLMVPSLDSGAGWIRELWLTTNLLKYQK